MWSIARGGVLLFYFKVMFCDSFVKKLKKKHQDLVLHWKLGIPKILEIVLRHIRLKKYAILSSSTTAFYS